MTEGSGGASGQGSVAIVKGEELDQMAAVAPRVEFGLGLGSPKPQLVTLNEDSKKASCSAAAAPPHHQQHHHHHQNQFGAPYNLEQRGAPFVTLATQDFLQPMERGVREASSMPAGSSMNGGEIPLQLSSADHLTRESRMQFQNLRMQYGNFMETPHLGRSVLESSQQSRHWHHQQQQQQQGVSNSNSGKRPRSAQSEGDETDDGDRRKIHQREVVTRDEANSRSVDAKGSASRSKHSATEQRRRSKINDRFQMLRDLLPHGDQKRDKASFLLEVIEYVQALKEKVKRFEAMERGRQTKAWDSHPSASMKETSAMDVDKERSSYLVPGTSPEAGNRARGYGGAALQSPANNHQTQARGLTHHHSQPLLSQISSAPAVEDATTQESQPARSKASTSHLQSKQASLDDDSRATTSRGDEDLSSREAGQKLPIKQGVISLSAAYSQGLLETLTSALQSSGLDLSKASISVQIELGRPPESQTLTEAPAPLQE